MLDTSEHRSQKIRFGRHLLEGHLPPTRPCSPDGWIFQLWLYRLDLLQLVLSLYGTGTRFRSESERALFHAAISFDDGFLSCRRSVERSADTQLWSSRRKMRACCRRAFFY